MTDPVPLGLRNRLAILRVQRRESLSRNCTLLLLAFVSCTTLFGQTITSQKQALLKRKGELLKSINSYVEKEKEAEATFQQAASIRRQAEAAADSKNAAIAAQAMDVAKEAVTRARNNKSEDQERLDAINTALGWPDSEKPQAVATLVRGHVFRKSTAGLVRFDPVIPIQPGDRISTGDDGFLEMQLANGSQMHIGPKSDFSYQQDVQRIFYELLGGKFHRVSVWIVGTRGANDEPRYKGLQAVAAVRGTEFTLEVVGTQDVFTVFDGELEVEPGGGRETVALKGGQRLVVPKSGQPTQRLEFDPNSAARWWQQ
jgi:biotin carboxyl carrier protein